MNKKKKICFVLPHFHLEYSGGAETQCYFLATELLKRDWEVHYIRESSTKETTVQNGIFVHGIPKQKSYKKWANREALLEQMKKIKADFWYTRANISYLYWLNRFAPQVGGQVIWAFSRDSQLSYRGEISRFPSPVLKAFHLINGLFFLNSLKRTNFILVQTQYQQGLLEKKFQLKGTHIYNAHPLNIQESDSLGNKKKQIVWIGRMQDFKHPERFLSLAEYCQDLTVEFLMIGPVANGRLDTIIKQKAKDLPNVKLLGKKKPEEVKEILKESLILVNTSDYEGFSNTFIEAWSQGVPVLSFYVDPDEIIKNHGLGWISNELNHIKKIISPIINNPSSLIELSTKCKEFTTKNFDIHKAVDKLEATLIN